MGSPDINLGVGTPSGAPIGDMGGLEGPQAPPPPPTGDTDTILQSEIAAIIAQLAAWSPVLTQPNDGTQRAGISPTDRLAALTTQIGQKEHDIISGMWDSFAEGLRELKRNDDLVQEKKAAEKAAHPDQGTVQYEHKENLAGRLDALESAFKQWLIDPAIANTTNTSDGVKESTANALDASFVASTLVIGSNLINGAIGQQGLPIDRSVSVNPIADAMAPGISPGLHPDTQAAADLIAALLYGGIKYKATVETIAQSTAKTDPPSESEFAMAFAKNVMTIVTRNIEGDQTETGRGLHQSQNKLIRLTLLTMALNLIYRTQYGGMTGEEFAGLLRGENLGAEKDTPVGKMMQKLINAIQNIIPGDNPETILEMMDYIDAKHSVASMTDTFHLLATQLSSDSQMNIQRKAQQQA